MIDRRVKNTHFAPTQTAMTLDTICNDVSADFPVPQHHERFQLKIILRKIECMQCRFCNTKYWHCNSMFQQYNVTYLLRNKGNIVRLITVHTILYKQPSQQGQIISFLSVFAINTLCFG